MQDNYLWFSIIYLAIPLLELLTTIQPHSSDANHCAVSNLIWLKVVNQFCEAVLLRCFQGSLLRLSV